MSLDIVMAVTNLSDETDGPQIKPLRCFLVEDSGLILRGLIDTLQEMLPLQVVGHAGDESSACQWLSESGGDIDLLIVDIFLRQGSGLQVLRHVSALSLGCRKVVLTNYATAEMRQRCAQLDADRVFDKSSELEELIDYCRQLSEKPAY
jgi:DNA-binding NarL/FixJ family response regulator